MKAFTLLVLSAALVVSLGCNSQVAEKPGDTAAVAGANYLLAAEPDGAQDIISVRNTAADGDDVLVIGRIGGAENPWVEGRAAFTIVDRSLQACSDIPGDGCPVPWDYCCETDKLPTSTALVKVVDADGQPVAADARKLLNVKELSSVVVQGKAQRDDAGNLTVLATGIYVVK